MTVDLSGANRRVQEFVADFHERWQRAGRPAPPGDHTDFAPWMAELAALVAAHGAPGATWGDQVSLSFPAPHDPATETITDTEDLDRTVLVRTEKAGTPTSYHSYELVVVDDEWRIARILTFLDPPGVLPVGPEDARELVAGCRPDAHLEPVVDDEVARRLSLLFVAGRTVSVSGETAEVAVRLLGTITTPTGVLAVRDLAYPDWALHPLSRQVPPGTYRTEVAEAAGLNLALRVRFSDAPTASWHPAPRGPEGDVVGVDAGDVAIHDLPALLAVDTQTATTLFERHTPELHRGVTFSISGDHDDAVMVQSGYGDGGYPCYLGAATDGGLTELVVDLLVHDDPVD